MSPQTPAGTWLAEDVQNWLAMADQRERALAPVLPDLMAAAALTAGERVLDVGCGTGPTTDLARDAVGRAGGVTGIDLAPELIAQARRRVPGPGITWVVGDAATYPLPDAAFDVVLSRFGVMFFADPLAAFRNLWRVTRLGGRLAVAVWPPREEIEYFHLPVAAVLRALDRAGAAYEPVPAAPGPFALGEPDVAVGLLNRAGWIEVDVQTHTAPLTVSSPDAEVATVAEELASSGLVRGLLDGQSVEIRRLALAELTEALMAKQTPAGVTLEGRYRILTARH